MEQALERRARRDEFILSESLQIARRRIETAIKAADASGGRATAILPDETINAETCYRWLKSLLATGKLPPDADSARPK